MSDFNRFMKKGMRGHLIGIGGVSMSPLAEVLRDMGLHITGSDVKDNENIKHLRELNIEVSIGHKASNLPADAKFVIFTAAIHNDNPEICEAKARGLKIFGRAEAWGTIMKAYKNALCISGTHGKTTTTSMCTHIMLASDQDPTVMIGGTLPILHASHRVGKGDTIILEACEYHDSFLEFSPTIATILDIEEDHLDYFSDIEHIKASFRRFAERTPENGIVVVNCDDEASMSAIEGIDRKIITFGLSDKTDVYARKVKQVGMRSEFDIYYHGKKLTDVILHVPGLHNIKNALAATASCIPLGVSSNAVKYGLAGFSGAGRRFEFKGKFNGADIYDDYAHHPGELKVLLDAVGALGYERVILVFQPHTYSRTKAFFDDFLRQLKRPDVLYLAEIYAARESKLDISSKDLQEKIPGSIFSEDFDELIQMLRSAARPGDIILTVGAGDVYIVGERLVSEGVD